MAGVLFYHPGKYAKGRIGHVFCLAQSVGRGADPAYRVATALHFQEDQRRKSPAIRPHNVAVWLRLYAYSRARWSFQSRDAMSFRVLQDFHLGSPGSKAYSPGCAFSLRQEKP